MPKMHRAHASQCSPGWRPAPPLMRRWGRPCLQYLAHETTCKWFEPHYGEMILRAGGLENGYIGDGDVACRKYTMHTHHKTQVRAPGRSAMELLLLPFWCWEIGGGPCMARLALPAQWEGEELTHTGQETFNSH